MAQTTESVTSRLDLGLRVLEVSVADLAAVLREWPELSDAERVSWSLDWDQVILGELEELVHARDDGHMTAAQECRLQAALDTLERYLPHLNALGLAVPRQPGEPLDDPLGLLELDAEASSAG